jgi:hypothetical protein
MRYQATIRLMARIAVTGAVTCGVAGAGLAAFAAGAGPAYAAGTIRYVGATAGNGKSCASPGYTSVQAAVDAARSGDTVYLCGTTPFRGQVIISKTITLTGSAGATIAPPSPWVASADPLPPQFASDGLFKPQALVVAWGKGVRATIRGLTVSGPLPGNGSCAEQEFGILVIGGANAQITDDAVTSIKDVSPNLYGCQYGVGIKVGSEYWSDSTFSSSKTENFTGSATITHTTVSGYQKAGIVVDGAGSSASISGDTVTGAGPAGLGAIIAQNGIQVSRGASGQVTANTVRGNQYSGAGAAADGGILIYGGCGDPLVTHVSVAGNTLTSNDVGVYLDNSASDCQSAPSTATGNEVSGNRISSPAVTNTTGESTSPACGYQAGISDLGNRDVIALNSISGAGYANHPTCSPAQPYVTHQVDTAGSRSPVVLFNF